MGTQSVFRYRVKCIVDKLRLLSVCQGQILVNSGNFSMNFSVLKCRGAAIGGCSSLVLLISTIEAILKASLRQVELNASRRMGRAK
jgi:hypothetical protein